MFNFYHYIMENNELYHNILIFFRRTCSLNVFVLYQQRETKTDKKYICCDE